MTRRQFFFGTTVTLVGAPVLARLTSPVAAGGTARRSFAVERPEQEWRARLTAVQYHVLREQGTERPFSSPLDKEKRAGQFSCAGCALPLFSSKAKFDSGTGWPSFYEPVSRAAVDEETDRTLGMKRTEVLCHRCGGHLGHVFDDGPKPTGLRYCMNGLALAFTPGAA